MPFPHLRLVPASSAARSRTPEQRICDAIDTMIVAARSLRVSSHSLKLSSQTVTAEAAHLEEKIPLFAAAEQRLLAERDRALRIAADASATERRLVAPQFVSVQRKFHAA